VTVYVDDWRQQATVGHVSGRWSHLLADTEAELHTFATRLGLRRVWFQEHHRHPARHHYDLTEPLRREAIALGAVPLPWREVGRMIRARRLGGATGGLGSATGGRGQAEASAAQSAR